MTDSTPTPECNGDDNCIECCPEVEVSMPGTIAALRAERDQYRSDASRLEAERDVWMERQLRAAEERDLYAALLKEAKAERDEWKQRHEDLIELAERIEAERDRYRDALERIAKYGPELEQDVARAALTPIEEQHHD